MEFKEGIAYAGLRDVWGGKMWFCIKSEEDHESEVFWTKKECIDYVRKNFKKETKRYLLNQLYSYKNRRAGLIR